MDEDIGGGVGKREGMDERTMCELSGRVESRRYWRWRRVEVRRVERGMVGGRRVRSIVHGC